MADAELKVRIDAEVGSLKTGLGKAERDLKSFETNANKSVNSFSTNASSAFKSAGAAIAGAISVGAAVDFGRQVLQATAEFEKMGAVLGNTLGSVGLAKLKLKEIEEFAARTPFGVNELTNSFVKLANQGFKPTGDQMRSLGDLASSTGKSFDQLAEAIIDAQVGEFERLKEFGVRAKDAGDKVIFTFKGVQTTVDKSSESIRQYISDLGNAEGVSGSMATISQTLTGKISNLGDAWDQMLISVGSNTSGVFSGAIDIISEALKGVTDFNNELETAAKFKIKGNAFETFVKYARTATNAAGANVAFATTQDILVRNIQGVEKGVNKLVSGTLDGAKSTSDFGDAIAKLKADGDKLIKGTSNLDLKAAYKTIYQEAVKALQDGRANFSKEASKPLGANFGTAKKGVAQKTGIDPKKQADDLLKEAKAFEGKLVLGLINFNANAALEADKKAASLNIINPDDIDRAEAQVEGFNNFLNEKFLQVEPILQTPFQRLGDYIKGDILPQLSSSFKTFFDDVLMKGEFSFGALGNAIKNTFLSVLANEATQSVLGFLSGKGGGTAADGTKKKGGGLLGGILGLVGIGGGGGAGAGAAAGGAGGIGKFLGKALPIAGLAVGAVGILGSLFKKKPAADPTPAPIANYATSGYTGATSGTDSGRVVFEISGTNLIGVLNRAGAKLQRYGG